MLGFFSLCTFIYTFVADHYQYAACIGPIALVAAGGAHALNRSGRNTKILVLSAAGILLITLGALTWRQCSVYKDRQTLWQDTLNKNPDSWLAHGQIAKLLFEHDKYIEAKPHLERAIELTPYMRTVDSRVFASFYYDLGIVLEKQDRWADAAGNFQKALDSTDYSELLMNVHYRLAKVLVYQGKDEQAKIHYLRAIELAKVNKNDFLADKSFHEMRFLGEGKKAFQ